MLDDTGVNYWQYESFRGGGYMMRLAEGIAANIKEKNGVLPGLGIRGSAGYSVLPPSIHPQGVVYRWIVPPGDVVPTVSINQVERFGVRLAKGQYNEPELYGLPPHCEKLSRRNRMYLALGTSDGNRNAAFVAVARDMAANHFDYDLAETLILSMNAICNPPESQKAVTDVLNWAYNQDDNQPARNYGKDKQNVQKPLRNVTDMLLTAAAFLELHDWRTHGRTAQTDRGSSLLVSIVRDWKAVNLGRPLAKWLNLPVLAVLLPQSL